MKLGIMEESLVKRRRLAADVASYTRPYHSENEIVMGVSKPQNAFVSRLKPPQRFRDATRQNFVSSTPIRARSPTNLKMNWQLSPIGTLLPDLRTPEENKIKPILPVKTGIIERVPNYLPLIKEKKRSVARNTVQYKATVSQNPESTHDYKNYNDELLAGDSDQAGDVPSNLLIEKSQRVVSGKVEEKTNQRKTVGEKSHSANNNENCVRELRTDGGSYALNEGKLLLNLSDKQYQCLYSDEPTRNTLQENAIITQKPGATSVRDNGVQKRPTGETTKIPANNDKHALVKAKLGDYRSNQLKETPMKLFEDYSTGNIDIPLHTGGIRNTNSKSKVIRDFVIMDSDEEEIFWQNKTKENKTKRVLKDIKNCTGSKEHSQEKKAQSAFDKDTINKKTETIDQKIVRSADKRKTSTDDELMKNMKLQTSITEKQQESNPYDLMKVSRIPKLLRDTQVIQDKITEFSASRPAEDEFLYMKYSVFKKSIKVVHSPKRPIVAIRSTSSPPKKSKLPRKTNSLTNKSIPEAGKSAPSQIPTNLKTSASSGIRTRKSRVSFKSPLVTVTDVKTFSSKSHKELDRLEVQNTALSHYTDVKANAELKTTPPQSSRRSARTATKKVVIEPMNNGNTEDYNEMSKVTNHAQLERISSQSKEDSSLQEAEIVEEARESSANRKKKRTITSEKASRNVSVDPVPSASDDDEIPAKQKRTDQKLKSAGTTSSGLKTGDGPTVVRRSTRNRSKPLEYWKGERLPHNYDELYSDLISQKKRRYNKKKKEKLKKANGREMKAVIIGPRDSGAETSKSKEEDSLMKGSRRKHIANTNITKDKPEIVRRPEDVERKVLESGLKPDIVFDPNINSSTIGVRTMINIPVNGKNIQMECLTDYATMFSNSQPIPGAYGTVVFGKGLQTAMGTVSSGSIEMSQNSSKGTQTPKLHHLIFCVMTGSIVVTIHHARKRIETGGHFFIPCGISYNIENFGEQKAVLSFFKIARGCISLDKSD